MRLRRRRLKLHGSSERYQEILDQINPKLIRKAKLDTDLKTEFENDPENEMRTEFENDPKVELGTKHQKDREVELGAESKD